MASGWENKTREEKLAWLERNAKDFAKNTAPIMRLLERTWTDKESGKMYYPTEKDIVKSVLDSVQTMRENPDSDGAMSGGVEVVLDTQWFDHEVPVIRFIYEMTEWGGKRFG